MKVARSSACPGRSYRASDSMAFREGELLEMRIQMSIFGQLMWEVFVVSGSWRVLCKDHYPIVDHQSCLYRKFL